MSQLSNISQKIWTWEEIPSKLAAWKNETIVFTNGCFDILHYGHLHYLAAAKDLGDKLIIGLNSADSVRRLKGDGRPVQDEATRQHLLAALQCVDAIVIFEEDTPLRLIQSIKPDILVKGGDYKAKEIVGYDFVTQQGGKVQILSFVQGYSTTKIINRIK